MALRCVRQPIILMGMARSGTTLVADLLYRLGLFIGHNRIAVDQEAKYFVSVNDMLLKRVHGYWDNPAPIRSFLKQASAVAMTVNCMQEDLRSVRVASYLGWRRYLLYRSLETFDQPWGWKDPRNVFTLPLWLRLFPEAKIIYLVRNAIDVAHSLLSLERTVIARRRLRYERPLSRLSLRSRLERAGFKGAARCLDIRGGFSLWDEYVAQAEEVLAATANVRRVLRYEDFLAAPAVHLEDLAVYCELNGVTERKIAEAVALIDPSRAFAFLSDPALVSFYREVKANPWMAHYSYSDLA